MSAVQPAPEHIRERTAGLQTGLARHRNVSYCENAAEDRLLPTSNSARTQQCTNICDSIGIASDAANPMPPMVQLTVHNRVE
ncbi:TPA: hypothetical protein ACH3X2_011763 [Trebouxia sp. C0005]